MSDNMQNIPEDILILLMQEWEGSLPIADQKILNEYLNDNPNVKEKWDSQAFLRNEINQIHSNLKPKKLSDVKKAQLLKLSQKKASEWKYWVFYGVAATLFFSMVGGFYYEAYQRSSNYESDVVYNAVEMHGDSNKSNDEKEKDLSIIDENEVDEAVKKINKPKVVQGQLEAQPENLTKAKERILDSSIQSVAPRVSSDDVADKKENGDRDASVARKSFSPAENKDKKFDMIKNNIDSTANALTFKASSLSAVALRKFKNHEWGFDKFKELSNLPEFDNGEQQPAIVIKDKVVEPEMLKLKKEKLAELSEVDESEGGAKREIDKENLATVDNEPVTKNENKVMSKKGKSAIGVESKEVSNELLLKEDDYPIMLDKLYEQLIRLNSYVGKSEVKQLKLDLIKSLENDSVFKSDPSFLKYLQRFK